MSGDLEELDIVRVQPANGCEDAETASADAECGLAQALASLESSACDLAAILADLAEQIKKLLAAAPASKVRIKIGSRVVAEIPVALGVAGGLLLSIAAVLISKTVIELERTSTDAPEA